MTTPSAQHPHPASARRLTDPKARTARRARAERLGHADWLHRIAADEVKDRLQEINRSFTRIAVVTPFAAPWRAAFPEATILPEQELLDLPKDLDLVIHAMALHWAEDPVGQIVQCVRALRPDGLFIATCPGGETLAELRAVLNQAEPEATGGLSPRVLPMGEIRDMGGLISRAGLALPVADHLPLRASYRDLPHLAAELRAMGETNAMQERLRIPTRREVFARAAALYAKNHPDPDRTGRILATFDLIFLTGWAPAPGQQQPLRPGSAKMPLGEALNARTP